MGLMEKIFGDLNAKEVKKVEKIVDEIEALDESMQALSDDELKAKTPEFKERLKNGETLDDILPEAYAVCREAAARTLGMKHFRVQLIGGVVLHQGRIAEMKTGEGKTLVATLPVYLNALEGKGVHVVTVNDYLAKRDCEWMSKCYNFLGLSVGCVIHGIPTEERKAAYQADITYGTNNEYGFDYLRDNMVLYKENMMQRELIKTGKDISQLTKDEKSQIVNNLDKMGAFLIKKSVERVAEFLDISRFTIYNYLNAKDKKATIDN